MNQKQFLVLLVGVALVSLMVWNPPSLALRCAVVGLATAVLFAAVSDRPFLEPEKGATPEEGQGDKPKTDQDVA